MATKERQQMQSLEKVVQQLRLECDIERIPVSVAAKELVEYCNSEMPNDYLITKTPSAVNHHINDKPCPVL